MLITNSDFLFAIFGEDYLRAHVTSFDDDPAAISQDRKGICWAGHHYADRQLKGLNQYYTVSLFKPFIDPNTGEIVKKRRKASFEAIYVICLDDVKEKLDLEQAKRLPEPSFILETSHGSEQWGYILSTPCDNMNQADNLLDGLVSRGLAPDGKDPGMKGVTRYVRLPEGRNTKANKIVFGRPFNCRLNLWKPENTYSMEQIAAPFEIDLNAQRREVALAGATDNDHPVIHKVDINSKIGPGQYDIRCPWIHEHTSQDNSGTAIFTNDDGTLGFKCHHGHCQNRTALDVIRHFDMQDDINRWKMQDLIKKYEAPAPAPVQESVQVKKTETVEEHPVEFLIDKLETMLFGPERNDLARDILLAVKDFDAITRIDVQKKVKMIMDWNNTEFKEIVKSLKAPAVVLSDDELAFYKSYVFVAEQNKFYHPEKKMWHTPEAFTNIHFHNDQEARKQALLGAVTKVDRIDYLPEAPDTFEENGMVYANIWREKPIPRAKGNCDNWLNHFKLLGWESSHMINWMAFTLQRPAEKINHGIILGGSEGSGKDWLLTPLKRAMGFDHRTIEGEELLKEYNNYVIGTKYLHINEVELGDNREALRISNKIKPMLAGPPPTLRIREMYAGAYEVRNLVNVTMATNSRMPLRLTEVSRRLYCLWSDFKVKDSRGIVKPQWVEYWDKMWRWMNNDGWKYCVDYLMAHDVSNFNPGAHPPVTEWLLDMVAGSQNTIVQTLNTLITNKYHMFSRSNRVTTEDIMATVSMAKRMMPEYIFCDKITPSMVDLNMKNMGFVKEGNCWIISDESMRLVK